jgi:hypothetical protein
MAVSLVRVLPEESRRQRLNPPYKQDRKSLKYLLAQFPLSGKMMLSETTNPANKFNEMRFKIAG